MLHISSFSVHYTISPILRLERRRSRQTTAPTDSPLNADEIFSESLQPDILEYCSVFFRHSAWIFLWL
ncbi:hypothetical protein Hanom_Chr06g00539201 [Helianthus anomalus]